MLLLLLVVDCSCEQCCRGMLAVTLLLLLLLLLVACSCKQCSRGMLTVTLLLLLVGGCLQSCQLRHTVHPNAQSNVPQRLILTLG
jgi:hypothetical protein